VGGAVVSGTVVGGAEVVVGIVARVARVAGTVVVVVVDAVEAGRTDAGLASVGPESTIEVGGGAMVVGSPPADLRSAPIEDEASAPNAPTITPRPKKTQRGRCVLGSAGAR